MTKRDRIVLAVLAVVAVVAAAWMLGIKPKREEASQLADSAAQAQQRRDTALASLANAKQARADFAEAQIGIARLGKAVPSTADIATLVFQLERSARAAGIDFRSVRLEEAADSGSAPGGDAAIKPVPFKLIFEGGFFDLRRFVRHANSFARMREGKYVSVRGRLLSIDGVSFVAGPSGFPELKAQITAKAYSAPAPTRPATATTATPASGTAAPATSGTPAAGSETPVDSELPANDNSAPTASTEVAE